MGIHEVLSEKGGRWTGNGKFIGMALAVSDAGIGVVIRSLDDQFKWIGRLIVRSITFVSTFSIA